jgi:hypothetical protein
VRTQRSSIADFRDRATYADPHQYPSGSRTAVLVNGAIVVENSVLPAVRAPYVAGRRARGRLLAPSIDYVLLPDAQPTSLKGHFFDGIRVRPEGDAEDRMARF